MPIQTKTNTLLPSSSFFFFFFFFFFDLSSASFSSSSSDALSLISFQSKADTNHNLPFFSTHQRFGFCHWPGVKCARAKVVRLVLDGFDLGGVFAPNTLSQLDQLRVLSLRNNSLAGPVPDISGLVNLKALFLDHNSLSGTFPPSILSLRRLRTLDLSHNRFFGPIPPGLAGLHDALYIRLESNRFTGPVPPLNQSFLFVFNVSCNFLTGAVPVTPALSRFGESSFSLNPGLCGEILQKECGSSLPFFKPWEPASATPATPPSPAGQNGLNQQLQVAQLPPSNPKRHPKTALITGFSVVSLVLIGSLLTVVMSIKKRRKLQEKASLMPRKAASDYSSAATTTAAATSAPVRISVPDEKDKGGNIKPRATPPDTAKSGTLVFCAGEAQVYSLEQLMRGSAELLGRGSIGSTYKAVLDNKITVTVKRLDGNKTCVSSRAMFERHIVSVSTLRHANLVPLRAYFQALDREERILIYDYQSNGSVFSLIHGERSARAKPLHWTSCLKIAEDVANGLAYIHQTVRLVHGNLKASNVLLGADFEALLTDYCLTVFARSSDSEDNNMASAGYYKAPEIKKNGQESSFCSTKSDVYAFGVLVLELLTGKLPSQLPLLMPATELLNRVRVVREEEGVEDKWMGMLVEIVSECCRTSPEQRPSMWQVLKMIQEIKEIVMTQEDSSRVFCS